MRRIPDVDLAYPVLVRVGGFIGSGFFLTQPPGMFFVTARHVLFDPETSELRASFASLMSPAADYKDLKRNLLKVSVAALHAEGKIASSAVNDVAVMRVGEFLGDRIPMSVVPGVLVETSSRTGIVGVPVESVRLFEDVMVGNDAVIFGYPASLGLAKIPQIDHGRPLLRAGIVAGKNADKGTIILDCPSYKGNSGGPAIEREQHETRETLTLIGVVVEYVPALAPLSDGTDVTATVNSGYSVVASMDSVMELLASL